MLRGWVSLARLVCVRVLRSGLTNQRVAVVTATYHPSPLSNCSILIAACFPPGSCTRSVWSVCHTVLSTFILLCCSYPPSDCYGAITSRRPVVRTAVKYRRLATGRLYGTSLPFRRFLTSSPVEFLPFCIKKTGKCRKKGEYIMVCHITCLSWIYEKRGRENEALVSIEITY